MKPKIIYFVENFEKNLKRLQNKFSQLIITKVIIIQFSMLKSKDGN